PRGPRVRTSAALEPAAGRHGLSATGTETNGQRAHAIRDAIGPAAGGPQDAGAHRLAPHRAERDLYRALPAARPGGDEPSIPRLQHHALEPTAGPLARADVHLRARLRATGADRRRDR